MDNLSILIQAKDRASKVFKTIQDRIGSLDRKAIGFVKGGLANMRKGFEMLSGAIPILSGGLIGLGGLIVNIASNANETRNRFNAVFGDMKDTAEDFAKTLADDTGRAIVDIRDGMSAFQSMAVGLGFADDEALSFSKKLQRLAIDFGSFNNLSDAEAQERFIAAMSGSSEVLDQFGVNIRAGALDQKLLAKGFPTIAEGATEAQKAIARLEIIEETMGRQGAIGDAVRTSGEFANQLRRGKALLLDYADTIGQRLLPFASRFLSWLFKVLPSQEKLNEILDIAGDKFNKFVKFIQPAIDFFKKLNEDGAILNSVLAGLAGAGLALLITGLITLIAIMAPVVAPFVLLGIIIAGLWYAWQTNLGNIQELTSKVFTYFREELLPPLLERLDQLKNWFINDAMPVIQTFLDNTWNNITTAFTYFKEETLPTLIEKFNQLKNWFIEDAMPVIQTFLDNTWATLTEAFDFFTTYILPALISVFEYVKEQVMNELVPAFEDLWGSIMELWKLIEPYILPILGVLAVVFSALLVASIIVLVETLKLLARFAKTTVDYVVDVFKALEKIVKGAIDFIAGLIDGDWNRAMSGFENMTEGAVDFVVAQFDLVKNTISDVMKGIQGLIDGTKQVGKGIGSKIPGFASGTSHFSGGLAQINERGPEMITLPSGTKIDTASKSKRERGKNSGNNITINFNPNINFNGITKPSRAEQEEIFENLQPAFIKFLKQKQVI